MPTESGEEAVYNRKLFPRFLLLLIVTTFGDIFIKSLLFIFLKAKLYLYEEHISIK